MVIGQEQRSGLGVLMPQKDKVTNFSQFSYGDA